MIFANVIVILHCYSSVVRLNNNCFLYKLPFYRFFSRRPLFPCTITFYMLSFISTLPSASVQEIVVDVEIEANVLSAKERNQETYPFFFNTRNCLLQILIMPLYVKFVLLF
jgi:hypothetical protein